MIDAGLRAKLACVDNRLIERERSSAATSTDSLLAELPPSIDPCGENGEFHTCVYAGPMFDRADAARARRAVITRSVRLDATCCCRSMTTCRESIPSRIVCLTEETTETLYLLGDGRSDRRRLGLHGPAAEARQKPRVSAFTHARYDRIEALEARSHSRLLRPAGGHRRRTDSSRLPGRRLQPAHGCRDPADDSRCSAVWSGCADRADALAVAPGARISTRIQRPRRHEFAFRPRVFFEEWDEPLISGIRWVEELVAIAGGEPIFPELASRAVWRKQRIVAADEVIATRPRRDHRLVVRQAGAARAHPSARTDGIGSPPSAHGHVYEVKSTHHPAAGAGGAHRRCARSCSRSCSACVGAMTEGRDGLQEAT